MTLRSLLCTVATSSKSPQSTAEGLEPALRQQKAFHSAFTPCGAPQALRGKTEADGRGRNRWGARHHLQLTWEKVDRKRAWGTRGGQKAQSSAEMTLIGVVGWPRKAIPLWTAIRSQVKAESWGQEDRADKNRADRLTSIWKRGRRSENPPCMPEMPSPQATANSDGPRVVMSGASFLFLQHERHREEPQICPPWALWLECRFFFVLFFTYLRIFRETVYSLHFVVLVGKPKRGIPPTSISLKHLTFMSRVSLQLHFSVQIWNPQWSCNQCTNVGTDLTQVESSFKVPPRTFSKAVHAVQALSWFLFLHFYTELHTSYT